MSRPLAVALLVQHREGVLDVEPCVTYRNRRTVITTDRDHILIGNLWFPLDDESLDSVRSWLHANAPDRTLSIAEYPRVLGAEVSGLQVLDDVDYSELRRSFEDLDQPRGLKANLYPYQREGFSWLLGLWEARAGGILGDEMGLGKTLQVIALLQHLREQHVGGSALIVVPLTLIPNWVREMRAFAPELQVHVHHGNQRVRYYKPLEAFDAVISTYETVISDQAMMAMIQWSVVVADEAQAVKNPDTRRAKALKELPRNSSVAVTGTPLENRALDLWSIGEFAMPGFLGTRTDFSAFLEAHPKELQKLARALVLRREVQDVASDLPERVDIDEELEMLDAEASAYERLREEAVGSLHKSPPWGLLTTLRLFTAHPSLTETPSDTPLASSAKLYRTYELLEEMLGNGHKVIVFSAFHASSDLIAWVARERLSCPVWVLDGRVPAAERQDLVDQFSQAPGSAVLVANTATAGSGLNIAAARHVIHYTLEWNPAREDQATARAYRRGQQHTVFVHRLFYRNTIDEAMAERLKSKRDLFDQVIKPSGAASVDELLRALRKSPRVAQHEG